MNGRRNSLFAFWSESFAQKVNNIVITLPGFGISHLATQYAKENNTVYVSNLNSNIGQQNILDLRVHQNKNILSAIDKYFETTYFKEKPVFSVIIDSPAAIYSSTYLSTYFSSHIYSQYYFSVSCVEEVSDFVNKYSVKVSPSEIDQIYLLSGGILRIVKYLIFNKKLLSYKLKDVLKDETMSTLFYSIASELTQCTQEQLESLGILNKGEYLSPYIKQFINKFRPVSGKTDIQISPDLSFKENNLESAYTLTRTEADILRKLTEDCFISKDTLSQIIWGDKELEKYSYWAITKIINRINKKLAHYKIRSVPKTGYKICNRVI